MLDSIQTEFFSPMKIGCVALPWHFEFYILKCKNLKCKNFLIDFLDELGNFKQKNFTLQNVIVFTL